MVAQNLMAFFSCLMPGEHLLSLQTDSRWWFLALAHSLWPLLISDTSQGMGTYPFSPLHCLKSRRLLESLHRLLSLCRYVKISQVWRSTLKSGNYCISAGKIFLLLIKVTPFFCFKFCPPFCLFLKVRLLQSMCGHTVGALVPVYHYYLA